MTHRRHYENYRAAKLSGIAQDSNFKTHDGQDPMMLMDAEKREHEQKLRKMEADMEAVFAQKVGVAILLDGRVETRFRSNLKKIVFKRICKLCLAV